MRLGALSIQGPRLVSGCIGDAGDLRWQESILLVQQTVVRFRLNVIAGENHQGMPVARKGGEVFEEFRRQVAAVPPQFGRG
jgi:hypothetical protein